MRSRHAAVTVGALAVLILTAATTLSAGEKAALLVATGNPLMPCTPGTRLSIVRGMQSVSQTAAVVGSAAAYLDGPNAITTNCNLDVNLRGQCWGTFEWSIPGKNGTWEGTWMGRFDTLAATTIYTATAVGSGGELDGLRLEYQAVMPGWSALPGVPNPLVFIAEVRGR